MEMLTGKYTQKVIRNEKADQNYKKFSSQRQALSLKFTFCLYFFLLCLIFNIFFFSNKFNFIRGGGGLSCNIKEIKFQIQPSFFFKSNYLPISK